MLQSFSLDSALTRHGIHRTGMAFFQEDIQMSLYGTATCNEEGERFRRYYEAAHEEVRMDCRRRYDRARAVILRCRLIWERLDQANKELAETRGNKWRMIFSGLLIAGGFLYSWVIPQLPEHSLADTLGTAIALWAAGYFVFLKWREQKLESDVSLLEAREADYLCEWQSTGAYSAEFWTERDRNREEIKLLSLESSIPEGDQARREEEIRASSSLLWGRARLAIFLCASGTRENCRLGEGGDEFEYELEPGRPMV
jgi:hypothetical protein